jgi:hypothetical protein
MDQTKVVKLETDGWIVGTPKEFLNLTEEDVESLEKEVPIQREEKRTHR